MEEPKPKLESVVFTFSQEGNCVGSTAEYEELTIEYTSDMGIDNSEGGFFVLKTTTGWSVNNENDIKELFDRVRQVDLLKP